MVHLRRTTPDTGWTITVTAEKTVKIAAILGAAALLPTLGGCGQPTAHTSEALAETAVEALGQEAQGLARKEIPAEDPGPPFYARLTSTLDQFFHADGWLAIPFYRDPACVPPGFNLLELFHFPGPDGAGAFACPILVRGFMLIEPGAPLGAFPRKVALEGDSVPFWFVKWDDFQATAADGIVTIAELEALGPIRGTADRYRETLKPRVGEHAVVISAGGSTDDGRRFSFHVTHLEDQTKSVQVRFR